MNYAVMLTTIFFGALIQLMIPPVTSLGQAKAPVLVCVVIYYALNRRGAEAALAALFAGMAQDLTSAIPIGYSSAILLIAAWLVSSFRKVILDDPLVTPMVAGFVTAFLFCVAMNHLLGRAGAVKLGAGFVWMKCLGWGLLALPTAPFVFVAARKMDSLVGNIEVRDVVIDEIE